MSGRQPTTRTAWLCRAGLIAVLLVAASGAQASVKSKILYSRGVLELNAGHTQAALDLFNQAVAEDPNDGYALYYRGVTRGQQGDSDAAIADLTATAIGALTSSQVGALTITQVDQLSTTNIYAMTTTQLAGFNATQIQSFDNAQVEAYVLASSS